MATILCVGYCPATRITVASGRRITLPANHLLFSPKDPHAVGDAIDPETVNVSVFRAGDWYAARVGRHIIVDNRVEIITHVEELNSGI